MERVIGTITDGDRVIVQDMSILMVETGSLGGTPGWQGDFELSRDATPPHRHRFYRLEVSDGRSGQIVFVRSEEIGSHHPTRVCFRTCGPFD
jgi:hypothetical protein